MTRLTFTLAGRDELSRVLNRTADASDRLRLRMAGITADADGNLRDLQGRFLSVADAQRRLDDRTAIVQNSFTRLSDATGKLGETLKANLISLAPAAIPAAAGLASSAAALAGQFGAVAVAAGAYALALGPQISAIGEAVDAQEKYEEAVRTSGATSQEAAQAQLAYQQQLAKMPPATREAAVAVGLLKDNFQEWSDSLAGDVMGPFTKGVAVANALLPETTGLVKGASTQFDRLITLVGGAISTPGFDRLNDRFTTFAEQTMRRGVDELTGFLAKLEGGEFDGGGLAEFFDYARENGPLVWDTLTNVGDALVHVLEAGSGVGVGMLEVINALAGIVSAVPPDAIATLLQLAIAIKAVKLAAVGTDAARAAVAALGVQIGAMRAAAAGAPGALRGTTAAVGALSRGAKLALAGTGLGLLLITLNSLSDAGRQAAPDVDKLALSLRNLADTGKFSGELKKTFGDMDGLIDKVRKLRAETEKANNTAFGVRIPGLDDAADWIAGKINDIAKGSESLKSLKGDFDSLDKGLASLVSNGYGDQAAASFADISTAMKEAGYDTKTINGLFGEYREALAAQALENRLAAESMGLFGEQAQNTQQKLDAQKASADGLRQSIQALNDVNRQGLSGMIGFEAAIDAAAKAAKENAGVLDMQGGKLTLNTEKQRSAAQALNDLAAKTDEATAAARDSGASWSEVNGIYERGRQQLIKNAQQMGLTRAEAALLADQILKTPDKTALLTADITDWKAKIAAAEKQLKTAKGDKRAKLTANIADWKAKVAEAERQLKNAKSDKRAKLTANIADWKAKIASAQRQINSLPPSKSTTLTITTVRRYIAEYNTIGRPAQGEGGVSKYASGGRPTAGELAIVGEQGPELVVFGQAARVFDAAMTRAVIGALGNRRLPAGRPARPGPAAAPVTAAADADERRPQVTYNVYPRASVISVEDLRLLQRQEEARQRVGRPR